MFAPAFWKAAGERAVKTFAQTLFAALTLSSVSIDVLHVNWVGALSIALGATVGSLLTSLAGLVPPTNQPPAAQAISGQRQIVQEALDRLKELDKQATPPAPADPAPAAPAAAQQVPASA